jgi:hypothetical protein
MKLTMLAFATLGIALASPALTVMAADPWADHVVSYVQGTGVGNDFVTGNPINNPLTALGEPTRFTSDPANFGGPTTPFSSAYRDDEIVSIGAGGSLTLQFDEPVADHPLNPFGVDLLVFGNAFYSIDFGASLATGAVDDDGGLIEVSANGVDFFAVTGSADGPFPTVGYLDVTEPFPSAAGAVLSDFTKPVNPASLSNVTGMTTSQIIAAYDGSGGGLGVDISSTGLASISFVRFSNPLGSLKTPEIDAVADVRAVPEPTAIALLALAGIGLEIHARTRRSR